MCIFRRCRASRLRHLNVKRGLGYLNWQRQRRRAHHRDGARSRHRRYAGAQARSYRRHRRSHQSRAARSSTRRPPRGCTRSGTPEHVTVVPGNHDIYSALRGDPGVERWADYMRADAFGAKFAARPPAQFPFVRRVGPSRSSVSTRPSRRRRSLPQARSARRRSMRSDKLLPQLEAEGLMRVVLIHHPPLPGQAPPRRALRDAAALSARPRARGAELVLHGHNHRDMHTDFARLAETGGGSIPVIGVASGSIGRVHKGEPLGRYNLAAHRAHRWSRAHRVRDARARRGRRAASRRSNASSSRSTAHTSIARHCSVGECKQSPRSVVALAAIVMRARGGRHYCALLNACARLPCDACALHKSMALRHARIATNMPRASPHLAFIVTLYRLLGAGGCSALARRGECKCGCFGETFG